MGRVERIGDSFAGRVTGIDVAAEPEPEVLAQVEAFLAEYPVLCFPGQEIGDSEQTAFVHAFGPGFEAPFGEVARKNDNNPKLIDVTNVEQDGSLFEKGSAKAKFYDANLYWHTDGSYSARPFRITALSARTLPSDPPDTEYADMRAAWDALTPTMRQRCEGLVVLHSQIYSRRRSGMGAEEFTPDFLAAFGTPTPQPLVRTHAISGRKSLYLSAHAGAIQGWPEDEGEAFLEELTAFATQRRFVYAHKWQPRDFMMWDDSATMHRATPYAGTEPRKLRWTAVMELAPLVA